MQVSTLMRVLLAGVVMATVSGCSMLGMGGDSAPAEKKEVAEKPAAAEKHAPAEKHAVAEKTAPAAKEHTTEKAAEPAKAADKKKKTKDAKPVATAPDAAKPEAAKPEPQKGGAALSEADGVALAKKSGCFVCHSLDKKIVGPAWKDVANKYRGQGDAESKLIAKVSKGGSGAWGGTAMPPQSPTVKDGDIKALVKFVLSLK